MTPLRFRAWDGKRMIATGLEPAWFNPLTGMLRGWLLKADFLPFHGDSAVLMQSTGLFDRTGKEIFEGDVVRFRANYTNKACGTMLGEVRRTPYRLILVTAEDEYDAEKETDEFPYAHCEVIGNILENPDLLSSPNAQ